MRAKKELREKISEADRYRRMSFFGLVVGIVMIVLGLLLFPALFIIGFTVFIICTGITSFLITLKWQYVKALKALMKEAKPQPINVCPRCGAKIKRNTKYCPKCGKQIETKKH